MTDPPIWDVLARIGDDLPPEEAAKLPADAAANVDHYLYGAPKVTPPPAPVAPPSVADRGASTAAAD